MKIITPEVPSLSLEVSLGEARLIMAALFYAARGERLGDGHFSVALQIERALGDSGNDRGTRQAANIIHNSNEEME